MSKESQSSHFALPLEPKSGLKDAIDQKTLQASHILLTALCSAVLAAGLYSKDSDVNIISLFLALGVGVLGESTREVKVNGVYPDDGSIPINQIGKRVKLNR